MAFNPGGTNYQGFLDQRRMADEGVTAALKAKGEREKQERIKKSGERSQFAKIGSAVARGAAAYYTGGLSEQMGGGEMIDQAMLGTDSEGRAVQNEYGGLVKAGSAVYQGSKAQKAGKLGEQDARFDKLLARRSKNVSDLYAAGDVAGGKEAQQALESMEAKYNANRRDAEGKGWGGSGLGMSDEDYQLMPKAMTQAEMDAKRVQLDGGGGSTPTDTTPTEFTAQEESRFRPRSSSSLMPPKADAPSGPTSFGVSDTSRGVQPVSAAETATAPSSQYQLQGKEREREQNDLIDRITGKGDKAPSESEVRQNRAIGGWMRTPLTLQPNEEGRAIDVTGEWGKKWKQRQAAQNAIQQGRVG